MNQKFWHEDKPGHINQDLETNKLKSVDSKQQRLSNRRMSKKEKKYSKLSTSREYLNPFACQTSPAFCLFLENKHKARGIPEPGHLREYHSQVQILHQEPSPIGYPHYPGPYQNHPVYHTPHGPVTVTVFNGTTYYHHQKNFETLLSGKVLYETDNPTSMCSNCGSSLPRERKPSFFPSALNASCSSTPHNNSCSIASHSGSSSRSSTPPSSYFGSSASARDSGLVSNTSTDDDASLIQESSYAELREEKLLREIKDAAEELMSDEYLTKNSYLLRQIKRNPEGYISIKLLACLKKIKKLTKSHHLLVLALKSSKELKMNDTNTKVKRSQPVSNQLMPKKETASLILIDPSDINGIEDIDRKFKKYGHLSQVQIVRPGRALPPHLKGYANAIPQLGEALCVIVEFESEVSAFAAYKDNIKDDGHYSVALLGSKMKRLFQDSSTYMKKQPAEKNPDRTQASHTTKATVARLNSDDSLRSQDSGILSDNHDLENCRIVENDINDAQDTNLP